MHRITRQALIEAAWGNVYVDDPTVSLAEAGAVLDRLGMLAGLDDADVVPEQQQDDQHQDHRQQKPGPIRDAHASLLLRRSTNPIRRLGPA